jgi:FHS family L-fucose permease-like MFS transporter
MHIRQFLGCPQVAASPLAAALGLPESSHFRLTFAQSFNSPGLISLH